MHHDRHIITNATCHVHNFINASVIASMRWIIDLLACWHFHKSNLSENVLRKPCLCHIIRSRVKNASSSSRVDPVVFMGVPVQLFDHIRIRSSGVTIPRMKTRGTLKVIQTKILVFSKSHSKAHALSPLILLTRISGRDSI